MTTTAEALELGERSLPRRRGIPDPRREAMWLLARAWGVDEVALRIHPGREVPAEVEARYREWIDAGRHGSMGYLERGIERRLDPRRVLPGARSVLCVALNYRDPEGDGDPPPGAGRVARHARGRHYQKGSDRSAPRRADIRRSMLDLKASLEKLLA